MWTYVCPRAGDGAVEEDRRGGELATEQRGAVGNVLLDVLVVVLDVGFDVVLRLVQTLHHITRELQWRRKGEAKREVR